MMPLRTSKLSWLPYNHAIEHKNSVRTKYSRETKPNQKKVESSLRTELHNSLVELKSWQGSRAVRSYLREIRDNIKTESSLRTELIGQKICVSELRAELSRQSGYLYKTYNGIIPDHGALVEKIKQKLQNILEVTHQLDELQRRLIETNRVVHGRQRWASITASLLDNAHPS